MRKRPVPPSPVPGPLERQHRLVLVHWLDSSSHRGVWKSLDDLRSNLVLECVSVGFVIWDSPEMLTLAAHVTEFQGSGDMAIPKCAITKIQDIGHLPSNKETRKS